MYRPPKQLFKKKSSSYYTNFTINGARVRRSCKTDNKKLAEEISLRLYNELLGQTVNPNQKINLTIDEVFARYWIEEGQYRASGENFILITLKHFLKFFGKEQVWGDINNEDVSRYVSLRRNSRRPIVKNYKNGDKVIEYTSRFIKPSTINKELRQLSHVNTIVKNKWSVQEAGFNIKLHLLTEDDHEKSSFSVEEEYKIYSNLPKHWQKAFKFALLTGVRAQNIFVRKSKYYKDRSVRRRDVFLDKGFIRFYAKSIKRSGKIIEIPIHSALSQFLTEELDIGMLSPEDYLFTYPKGHRFEGKPLGDYRHALYKAMKEAGLTRKLGEGMHGTRHTLATRLVESGVDSSIVQKILGHSSISTTMEYIHQKHQVRKEALEQTLAENWQNRESDE